MNQESLLKEIEFLRRRVAESQDAEVRLARVEQALHDSEERFRVLCEHAPLGCQSLDEEGRIVEVNAVWLEILGYSREEVAGRCFRDFLAPAYHERFNADFQKSKATGEIHWADFDMVLKDGSTVSMCLDGCTARDQSGCPKHTYCLIHDISSLRQSGQELRERQERLSLALDGASLGIWDWNLTTGEAYWTARTLGMLGYEASEFELNLKSWKRLVHSEDWPTVTENLRLHIEGKEPSFSAEYRIMNKAGQWQWVRARGRVSESGPDGKPARMAGVVVDVTDLKREEAKLQRVNRALKTLSECNQALVRAQDEATLVSDLCRILVEHGGYRMAWIGFAEQDAAKSVRPVAQTGFQEGYLNQVSITWADSERGRCPTGTAIRKGKPVIGRDITTDPLFDPWREAPQQLSIASSAAFPLTRENFVFGAVNVYSAEPDAFETEEVRLLSELADDLAYGIAALRVHRERERAITEQKRTEEELRHREERYRTLVEESFDGIFVQRGPKIVFANSRLYEMLGYDKGELEGLDHWLLYHPDHHAITRARAQARMRGEDPPTQYEVRLQRKDGESFEGEIRARSISVNGEDGVQVWVKDISERKQTENRLRDSERKYRELVELANSIILRWTREGRITFLNEFGQRFFGYSLEEVLGRHVVGTIVPVTDSVGRDLAPVMDKILADPKAFEQNINENMRRDGERVLIAWTNKIVPDEQGRIGEVLSIGMDVTELKRAQEEIKDRNAELRSINRIVSAVSGFLDLEALLEQVLDEALELVGLEGGTVCLVAQDGTLELHANRAAAEATIRDLSTSSVRVGDCLCGNSVHTLEPLILRDRSAVLAYATREATRGDPILFHAAFPLVTASTCVGILCIFTRTEKKPSDQRLKLLETVTGQLALAIENAQLYEASQGHAEKLERIVAERTRELAHAKERAEAADHLKSAFLATMSHELRTPLNSIIGFTSMVLKGLAGPLNAEQSKQLEMVRSSSRHLLALINDVLDISKIEAGQLEVASERFDLRASIDKVLGIVAPLAEKKGLALCGNTVAEVGETVGDQRRVEQILLNLLNNAIKFTDTGEVGLAVELIPDYKSPRGTIGEPAVRMRVSDTGIGIRTEDLATLFQPFRQIESGLSRNYEGTGLGLAICRRLADLMGGDIRAESTWTKGSTFIFTLPLKGPANNEGANPPHRRQ
jgi:PAS domain S-box-containing protein